MVDIQHLAGNVILILFVAIIALLAIGQFFRR